MKTIILGLFAFCIFGALHCEFVDSPEGPYYNFNNARYAVSEAIARRFRTDPSSIEQSFLGEIKNGRLLPINARRPSVESSRRSDRPDRYERPKYPSPYPEEDQFNSFSPNKNRPSGIHFPDQSGSDQIQTQSTGVNRKIPREREREEYRGNKAVTEFAWNLFKNSNSQPNFVLSPLSPQILLSYLAWVADGQTRAELLQGNGYGSPNQMQRLVSSMLSDSTGRELQIATAFFVSEEMRLNQEFLDKSVQYADVVPVDFKKPQEASRTISKWAKGKTKGGLKLNDINYAPNTKIALTSAMYFKGNWVYTFHPAKPGIFNAPNGPVEVQMMNMKRKFRWGKIGTMAEWVALPYESSDSLVIILPNEGQKIDDVINSLSYRDLDDVMYGIDSENTRAEVNITLPKFKLESTTSLVEPLQKMGITTLFSPRAQLPYLSDYDAVQVSNAQQQASMEVNENGTVLITFTNLNVVALSFQPPVPNVEFTVNRPFIAIIADRNKNIPFVISKVSNPSY